MKQYKGAIEAMLFAVAEPISAAKLAEVLQISEQDTVALLNMLQDDYLREGRGLVLLRFEDRWQLSSDPSFEGYVRGILDNRRNTPLSPSALEILAVVAYNQPVSRSFVEQVRGVDCTSGISTLQNKGLIEEQGRLDLPGRPIAYGTTDVFLRAFGLSSLDELPSLSDQNEGLLAGYIEEE